MAKKTHKFVKGQFVKFLPNYASELGADPNKKIDDAIKGDVQNKFELFSVDGTWCTVM